MLGDKLLIQSDSQLVVGQLNAEYESRDPRRAKYVSMVKQHLGSFLAWKLEHIPRDCNEKADPLAAIAASLPMTETVFLPIYYQPKSSIITTRVTTRKIDFSYYKKVVAKLFILVATFLYLLNSYNRTY